MGCTVSRQNGASGYNKKRLEKTSSSWYAPLSRSSSTPMPQYPILEPFPWTEQGRCSFQSDDNPDDTGSFIRLLYKKKSISPISSTPGQSSGSSDKHNADHHHHHQLNQLHHRQHHNNQCLHHHHHHHLSFGEHADAGVEEYLQPSIKKRTPAVNLLQHSYANGNGYVHPSLQQLQLVKLSTQKNGVTKKDNSIPNGAYEDEQSAHQAFWYPECSPPPKAFIKRDEIDLGRDGDDEGGVNTMDGRRDITHGLRSERRKSRFAPKPDKSQHYLKGEHGAEKPSSLNTTAVAASDKNELTETGSQACNRPKHTHAGEHPLRKRRKSRDVSDPDHMAHASLEGLEEQLIQRVSYGGASYADQQQQIEKGLVETDQSPEDVESESNIVPDTCTPISSAFNEVNPGGSQLSTPPTSPSKSSVKSSTSPLFDPSILAVFEEAVESVRYCAPDDDWMLVNDTTSNEPSSLSSSEKFTWVSSEPSSEPSSDAENRKSGESFGSNPLDDRDLLYYDELHHEKGSFLDEYGSTIRHKVDGLCYRDADDRFTGSDLDRFEARCPPRGEDRVVFYFTSLRGIRRTFQDCCALRLILQGLGVDVDERDVWMHSKFREELTDLLGDRGLPVPRLFIKGRYIGGADEVKQLHEDGLLVGLIEDMPTFGKFRKSCDGCADRRFVLCLACRGSCKLLDDEQDQVIKCFECNENGLIMCPLCRS